MAAAATDLCTLADVKAYLANMQGTADDALLQQIITAVGEDFLRRTGRDTISQQLPFVETYDGTGGVRQFTRNYPIVLVSSVSVNGSSISPSTGYGSNGYTVDGNRKSIVLPGYGYWNRPCGFPRGVQNVQISYQAGYGSVPPDLQRAAVQTVAAWYDRRRHVDESSIQAGAQVGGQTMYRSWDIPPEALLAVQQETRVTPV